MTKSERVILIQGDADKWYEQAIFIVKPDNKTKPTPVDMVIEAEKIIHAYLIKNNRPLPAGLSVPTNTISYTSAVAQTPIRKRKKKRVDFFLNALMVLACIALGAVLMWGL